MLSEKERLFAIRVLGKTTGVLYAISSFILIWIENGVAKQYAPAMAAIQAGHGPLTVLYCALFGYFLTLSVCRLVRGLSPRTQACILLIVLALGEVSVVKFSGDRHRIHSASVELCQLAIEEQHRRRLVSVSNNALQEEIVVSQIERYNEDPSSKLNVCRHWPREYTVCVIVGSSKHNGCWLRYIGDQ